MVHAQPMNDESAAVPEPPAIILWYQYSLGGLLWFFTCLNVWFGCIARGHYLFGSYGAITFGLFFGIALFFLFRMLVRWHISSIAERSMFTVTIVASLSAGFYLANVAYGFGFHITHESMRQASRLQATLHEQPRFRSVMVTFEKSKGEWLWVGGSVRLQQDLEDLHLMIDDEDKWYVEWEVDVLVSERMQQASRLQATLHEQPRFHSVMVLYDDLPNSKAAWLWVRGSVRSQQDLNELHVIIDDEDKWHFDVDWEVNILKR